MKFCMMHWNKIREAIKDKGLWHLVAATGEEAMENAISELQGEPKEMRKYDPLAAATWMIYGRAIEVGGLYLMSNKEDGSEYCPLCECDVHSPKDDPLLKDSGFSCWSDQWISGCTDSILTYCREEGLVAQPS